MTVIGRMKKDIRMSSVMSAVILGMIAGEIMLGICIQTHSYSEWMNVLIVTACTTLVLIILSVIRAAYINHRLKKRIQKCGASVSLDDQVYTKVSNELCYGSEWLVYHKGNTYLVWTKDTITSIEIVKSKKLYDKGTVIIHSELNENGEAVPFKNSTEDAMCSLILWSQKG